ncbi:MAG: 6-O-methylguanine DNA methyltransferase [Gammaproteobacteria bacterium]|nr:6-O-methylguanine DNA methyltransferase [Gammaproteobacteria bacterium]
MSRFTDHVTEALQDLAPGEVVTYGELAAQAGHPGAARAVGNILSNSTGFPWWRVVTSTGRLIPRHEAEQTRKLEAEGVTVRDGRVVTGPALNGRTR